MGTNGEHREFELRPHRPLEAEVQRVAREQIHLALAEIGNRRLDRNEVIHEVRKRCKKIRALLRLVRPELDIAFQIENAWYRDASRSLSFVRDAHALVETCEALGKVPVDRAVARINTRVRKACGARLEEVTGNRRLIGRRLAAFARRLDRGAERISGWSLQGRDRQALRGGVGRTYRRARKGYRTVFADPSDEAFHDWRKRVKYHWYHLRLLRGAWPEVLAGQIQEVRRLGQGLGDHHDLVVLRDTLHEEADRFALSATAQKRYLDLIRRRQRELEAEAAEQGAQIFQERPQILSARIQDYWYPQGL